jgi:carboxynorspermidine decarboxylase
MMDGKNGMSSPTFILDSKQLRDNLKLFQYLAQQTNTTWLYTIKAFHESGGLEIIDKFLDGFSIGNQNEYSYIQNSNNKHIHSYAPAFYEDDIWLLSTQSTTLSFNSLSQWHKLHSKCNPKCSLGLRINPKLNLNQPSYCDANHSRLGLDYEVFLQSYHTLSNLEGLHFHIFCYQDIQALKTLIKHIQTDYSHILPKLKWLNLGGGQNFTHPNYNKAAFIDTINSFNAKYPNLQIIFEPASSVLENCGYFETTILDIIPNKIPTVILNTSIETHLLDIAITKQSPNIQSKSGKYCYELTGMSCIAGDIIGRYNFENKLNIGDKIIFKNMLGYTLSKQTNFNGLKRVNFKII